MQNKLCIPSIINAADFHNKIECTTWRYTFSTNINLFMGIVRLEELHVSSKFNILRGKELMYIIKYRIDNLNA